MKKSTVSKNDTQPVGFRLKHDLLTELEDIAEYENALNLGDLVRTWIRAKALEYKENDWFAAWKKQRDAKRLTAVLAK